MSVYNSVNYVDFFYSAQRLSMSRLILLVLLVAFGGVNSAVAESLKGSRPNVILMITDDQGYGPVGRHGHPWINTPNLDRLYDKSTRFTRFLVAPTCAPTRSALMTGRHPMRNGVTHTILERERMTLDAVTLPQVLKKAGYTSGIFGKWHLGDEERYQPHTRGFDEAFIHGAGGIGQAYKCSCADAPGNKYFDPVIRHNGTFVKTSGFCTDLFFTSALGWIKEVKDKDEPFFAYITTNAPHGPFIAPPASRKRFEDMGFDGRTAGFYGMIENIDDNFGLLMQKLDEWKLWDNTLVIFMTDNGQAGRSARKNGKRTPIFTTGFKTGKGSPFEGGTHVPAFWRWKGKLAEGIDIPALTGHIDLFDTFCDLAKVDVPNNIQPRDGKSLLPLLQNSNYAWPDRNLFFHVGRWEKGEDPNLSKHKRCAIRTERWRLVNNSELYDIQNDPYESNNVADQHPDVIAKLRKSYDQWWSTTVPLMVNEDVPLAKQQPQTVRYEKQKSERGIPDWNPPKL